MRSPFGEGQCAGQDGPGNGSVPRSGSAVRVPVEVVTGRVTGCPVVGWLAVDGTAVGSTVVDGAPVGGVMCGTVVPGVRARPAVAGVPGGGAGQLLAGQHAVEAVHGGRRALVCQVDTDLRTHRPGADLRRGGHRPAFLLVA